jgi:hypothetical protein
VTELRRLFDAEPDEFALELLRSAHDDGPAATSFNQAAAALGVGAVLAGTTAVSSAGAASAASLGTSIAAAPVAGLGLSAAAGSLSAAPVAASTAATITFAVLAKQAAIGMVAGLAVMGGFYTTVGSSSSDEAKLGAPGSPGQTSLSAPGVARRTTLPNRDGAAAPSVEAGPLVGPLPVTAPVAADGAFDASSEQSKLGKSKLAETAVSSRSSAARSARATSGQPLASEANAVAPAAAAEVPTVAFPATPAPAQPAEKSAATDPLSLEVGLLDRARTALAAGDADRSLAVLDEYQRGKPSGILAPEAQVLRIQVLERLGRTRAAAALARDFVSRHPGSRHAAALRVLAERADARP